MGTSNIFADVALCMMPTMPHTFAVANMFAVTHPEGLLPPAQMSVCDHCD